MTQIGETKKGIEISKNTHNKYIWSACELCGRERWVQCVKGQAVNARCVKCNPKGRHPTPETREKISKAQKGIRVRDKNQSWKGGRIIDRYGYIRIRLQPDNFFFSMAQKGGYVFEHRLVVAKALGRCLHSWEIVHHKGDKYPKSSKENKQDNRYPENLQLVSDLGHKQLSLLERKLNKVLEKQNELMKEIRLLRFENKLLREKTSYLT